MCIKALAKGFNMKTKEKTYLVFIDNFNGTDGDASIKKMTGNEIREEFKHGELDQIGVAIVEGNLIKSFESVIDLKRL